MIRALQRSPWLAHIFALLAARLPLAAGAASAQPCLETFQNQNANPPQQVIVAEVKDGDTIIADDGTQIRLTGIRAPKFFATRFALKKAPYADTARRELSDLVEGHLVTLFTGSKNTDRYQRITAHAVRPAAGKTPEIWLQGELLRKGLARVDLSSDNRICADTLLAMEAKARHSDRALWSSSFYRIRSHDDLANLTGTFQLVEGTILAVAERRKRYFLNFGADWRQDFTITIAPKNARRFVRELDPETLKGQKVRVRGWVEAYNGPFIEVSHPDQIEIIPEEQLITPF